MGSLTIRNLDDDIKQRLREAAARNGRSMEEEVRRLLAKADTSLGLSQAAVQPKQISPFVSHKGKARILLIISGGIAAYKSLDLIRRLKEYQIEIVPVMTRSAAQFITPLAVGALAHTKVYTDLFDREAEQDIGHIRLARDCDLVLVAPATADLMARMATGQAHDLASTVLLATGAPVVLAPAMNPAMWNHPATRRNTAQLLADGVQIIGPERGEMAERGEAGRGRMSEPTSIASRVSAILGCQQQPGPLAGRRALVTSGPTHEPIDPVRYIANRSSGKQGHAIAAALARAGAHVELISGPVELPDPDGVLVTKVQTARQMLEAAQSKLPADVAVMVAAVADFRASDEASQKIKKTAGKGPQPLALIENPDILYTIAHESERPDLVIGFAAETESLEEHAKAKLARKGADWIVANDVSHKHGVMGGDENTVAIVTASGLETLPKLTKHAVADELVKRIEEHFVTKAAKS